MRYSQALVTEYMCLVRYKLNPQEVSFPATVGSRRWEKDVWDDTKSADFSQVEREDFVIKIGK